VASPSNADLWVVYASPGKIVKKGGELFNLSITKHEKAVYASVDGIVRRVLKTADYTADKKMVPVREGELVVELAPVPNFCTACSAPVAGEDFRFCPYCGSGVEQTQRAGQQA